MWSAHHMTHQRVLALLTAEVSNVHGDGVHVLLEPPLRAVPEEGQAGSELLPTRRFRARAGGGGGVTRGGVRGCHVEA